MFARSSSLCLVLGTLTLLSGCTTGKGMLSFSNKSQDAQGKVTQEAEFKFEVARVNEKQGKLLPAKELYLELLAKNPQDSKVMHRLGIVHARLEDHSEAANYFVAALKIDKHNADILTDFGYSLYLKGDDAAAETALKQAMNEDNHHQRAVNNLAMVVGRQGRMEESYGLLRRFGNEAEATANLAYVYAQQGDIEEATKGYSRALSIDNDLEKASSALVQIARSQTRPAKLPEANTSVARKSPVPAPRKAETVTPPTVSNAQPAQLNPSIEILDSDLVESVQTSSAPAAEKWYQKWENGTGVTPVRTVAKVDQANTPTARLSTVDDAEKNWAGDWEEGFSMPVIRTPSGE